MSQEERILTQEIIDLRKKLSAKRRGMADQLAAKQLMINAHMEQLENVNQDIERLLAQKNMLTSQILQARGECRDIYKEYRELALKANYSISETEKALQAFQAPHFHNYLGEA